MEVDQSQTNAGAARTQSGPAKVSAIARKRRKRLLKDGTVKNSLSLHGNVLKTATSITEIDTARIHPRRSIEDALKRFETSKARIKDLHNHRLHTKGA
ncbi:hypothetical protein BGZ76_007641 [Entomortierella beljakovae]|nr:hypothetical protein BGZ76_007641 [Entomortierella beljakovae]